MDQIGDEFSVFADQADYDYIQKNIGLDQLDIMVSHPIIESDVLAVDPGLLDIPVEEASLNMEFKCMHDNAYLTRYPKFPPADPKELCNVDYAGPLHFEAFVDLSGLKNPWEYSPQLNKLYIDMTHTFPVNFSVESGAADEGLFVRIMPMFEEDRYYQELVCRCISHEQAGDPTNQGLAEGVIQHIMRCENASARYFGDAKAGRRLSVVMPLSSPQAGTDSVKEFFNFVCKSSCPGGMGRKPIHVIFTLENEHGEVLGRRVLRVRICSCPKRDREKEENKKKNGEPSGKKRKIEKKIASSSSATADTRVFPMNFTVVGEENYKCVAKYVHDLMAGVLIKMEGRNASAAPFRKCLSEISNLMNTFSE